MVNDLVTQHYTENNHCSLYCLCKLVLLHCRQNIKAQRERERKSVMERERESERGRGRAREEEGERERSYNPPNKYCDFRLFFEKVVPTMKKYMFSRICQGCCYGSYIYGFTV